MNKSFGIALFAILLLLKTSNTGFAQNNIELRQYGTATQDFSALDSYFDNLTGVNTAGNPVTYTGFNGVFDSDILSQMPTSVAAYNGVDLIILGGNYPQFVTQAQADALVDFVTNGGILVATLEGLLIRDPRDGIRPGFLGAFLANELNCNDCYQIHTMGASDGIGTTPDGVNSRSINPLAAHPGSGNLLLTTPGWNVSPIPSDQFNRAGSAWYVGVPSENAIIYANPTQITNSTGANATCESLAVLELVVPAYPGTSNACNVQGMAILVGDLTGGFYNSDRPNYPYTNNLASLLYDFMYDPTAMAARNAWSATPSNVNTGCPPAASNPTVVGTGTIDCSKTQIATAPVAGQPGQKTLMVTMNVTTVGCISPITVSGSGMSVANGITEVCATTTGIQTFSIPVNYDGSALGTMNFSIGAGNNCTADLTNTLSLIHI